jgi:hypothetical protein
MDKLKRVDKLLKESKEFQSSMWDDLLPVKQEEQKYTQPTVDIKQFFSLMPVKTLREIAMKHNILTGIKAPSQMLKAELVQSLSNHYVSLTGNSLYPLPAKKLEVPFSDIPEQWKPKKAPKELTEKEKALKEWAKQHIRVKKTPYEIAKERREDRKLSYGTEKKLKEAIIRRERRQEKAKETRQKKKEEEMKSIKKAIVKEKKDEEKPKPKKVMHPIYIRYQELLKEARKLDGLVGLKEDKEFYNNLLDKLADVDNSFSTAKKKMSKTDIDEINTIQDKIGAIVDDDNIIDKLS